MSLKFELRKEAMARREALARAQPGFALAIAAFAKRVAINKHTIVSGYWPMRDEADPRPLMAALAERGATLALPRAETSNPLVFHEWREGDVLHRSKFGVDEPHLSVRVVVPDVLLLPLLAFDADGHRLGYGGGHYDRTLAELRARKSICAIGVGYAGQEVLELPREPHDHPLDMIVTELGLRSFGGFQ
jgi:5-formyltetrahydrofolate cyclo-ligase